MLGKSLASPLLTCEAATRYSCFHLLRLSTSSRPNLALFTLSSSFSLNSGSKNWKLQSIDQQSPQVAAILSEDNEDEKAWEECKQLLSTINFTIEEAEVILGKAFGWAHSPYWGEARKKQVPRNESVSKVLDYLRSLGLASDEDLRKLLKKFPEVLGCDLDVEVKTNVAALEKEWGIEGKALRSLLLRNPKVLGYNVDCKGDCMAKCTRCWVRF